MNDWWIPSAVVLIDCISPSLESPIALVRLNQFNLDSFRRLIWFQLPCLTSIDSHFTILFVLGISFWNLSQVYGPRIDDPASKAFERCSSDTYQITGPCTYQLCYVYLYRSGIDGWMPESVQIYGSTSKAVSFYYNTFIPNEVWYGFNLCNSPPSSSGTRILTNIVQGLLLSALLFFCM